MEKPTGGQQTTSAKRDDDRSNPNRVPESSAAKDAKVNPKGSPEPARGDDDRSNPNRAPQTGPKEKLSGTEESTSDTGGPKTDAQKGGQPNDGPKPPR